MNNLAIIPARGGSKRIPKKNIRTFNGIPIITYSIRAAIDSDCFNEIMVSTDDKKIAEISKSIGAKIPFFRSDKTANDSAGLAEVIEEVIIKYNKIGKVFESVCCILPTAPFITSAKINDAFATFKARKASAVISVVRFSYPILRALKVENGLLEMIWPEHYLKRSQDLQVAYHDAGQFYWLNISDFLSEKKLFLTKSIPYEISEIEMQDIDTEEDWKIAELKYKLSTRNIE